MSVYTVESASVKKTLQLDHGEFTVYTVTLQGHGDVELKQKASSPAPAQGASLTGTIEDTQYGRVFKKEFQPRPGGGGYQPDPAKEARIVRQHSQQMAIYWFEILKRHDMLTPEQQAKGARYLIDLTDFFQADAMKERA